MPQTGLFDYAVIRNSFFALTAGLRLDSPFSMPFKLMDGVVDPARRLAGPPELRELRRPVTASDQLGCATRATTAFLRRSPPTNLPHDLE